jgi:hypothetical protein
MKNTNQGVGARFVRNVVMGMMLSLVPLRGAAADPLGLRDSLLPTVVTCPLGAVSTVYTPGLRGTGPQNVTQFTEAVHDTCVSLLGEPVSRATAIEEKRHVSASCGPLSRGDISEVTVQWDTGERSTLELTVTSVSVDGLATLEVYNGTVKDGKYRGAQVLRTVTYLNTDFLGGCASVRGLTEAHGVTNLGLTLL